MGEIDDLRWANRPLRHMTMAEVQRALSERRQALGETTSRSAYEQVQLAIERLQTEIEGRRARSGA